MKRKKSLIIALCVVLLIGAVLLTIYRPHNQGLYKVTVLSIQKGNLIVLNAINDFGQIAGFTEVSRGVYNAFLWDHEKELRELGPVINMGVYLNNAGQIAGSTWDITGNSRAFIWDPNIDITILPTLGGMTAFAYGINDLGQVVGSADTASGVPHAFLWDAQLGIMDLTPESRTRTVANSIND